MPSENRSDKLARIMANLRPEDRAVLQEEFDQLMARSRQRAMAAIMARNFSHNLGSRRRISH